MTLNELEIGKSAIILQVLGEGKLRHRLLEMGLTPRTKITKKKMAPMGDPMEILIRGYVLTLRIGEAEKIEVIEVEDE